MVTENETSVRTSLKNLEIFTGTLANNADRIERIIANAEDVVGGADAKLNDIARHVKFSLGDTLVSSGFKSFPEGIIVGTINNFDIRESDAYYNIQVRLAVDFRSLTHVKVINYKNYQEQTELEKGTPDEKTISKKDK